MPNDVSLREKGKKKFCVVGICSSVYLCKQFPGNNLCGIHRLTIYAIHSDHKIAIACCVTQPVLGCFKIRRKKRILARKPPRERGMNISENDDSQRYGLIGD